MKIKACLLAIPLLLPCAILRAADTTTPGPAASRGTFTHDPGCNNWREIQVPFSTTTPVVVSSSPKDATEVFFNGTVLSTRALGVSEWSSRFISNNSNGAMMIVPHSSQTASNVTGSNFTSFQSSFSIVLSSDPNNTGAGDVYIPTHQGPVYAIWSPGTTSGGAGGEEDYCK